jgi:amino acid adenylation domain-containing protein
MFRQVAERYSNNWAIAGPGQRLTYGELEKQTNNLANFLLDNGAVCGSVIGILVEDPIAAITAILSILKAGSIYVPLDVSLPDRRLAAMLEEVKPSWIVTEVGMVERLKTITREVDQSPKVILTDDLIRKTFSSAREMLPAFSGKLTVVSGLAEYHNPCAPTVSFDHNQMCYVYFTSGSTGKPKGIAGRLKGIDHFIRWEIETLQIREGIRVSQLLPLSFDGSVRDIFVPLCSGGTVCVPDSREILWDSQALLKWLDEQEINLVHCVPSLFRALINAGPRAEQLKSLQHIVMAGEAVLPADVGRWMEIFSDRVQLVNLYGTSETTLAKFAYFIKESDKDRPSIPVGKPIPGARALVLDEKCRVCPTGAVGEIYIRTPYRSLGYFNRPELTCEVFVKNPLSDDPEDIVYKTGDLGRILEDGNFEFIGRKDQQVKIRGVRVELGEVENALREHEAVQDVAVIDRAGPDSTKYLCAYVVAGKVTSAELYETAIRQLPAYIAPSAFVFMDKLPRTISGKIDRRALPELEQANGAREYIEPQNELEEVVAGIWAETLGLKRVSIRDNFFQLGGHSLLSTQVVSRIREALMMDLPLSCLFEYPTVETLSSHLVTIEPSPGHVEKVARLLKRVNSMSDENLKKVLNEKMCEVKTNEYQQYVRREA